MATCGCRPKSVYAGLDCGLGRTPALSVSHSVVEAAYAVCGSCAIQVPNLSNKSVSSCDDGIWLLGYTLAKEFS